MLSGNKSWPILTLPLIVFKLSANLRLFRLRTMEEVRETNFGQCSLNSLKYASFNLVLQREGYEIYCQIIPRNYG